MIRLPVLLLALYAAVPAVAADATANHRRVAYLVESMQPGPLRDQLQACLRHPETAYRSHRFSISHRGAPFAYPEHTVEGYRAAAAQGAARVECDATPTRDGVLVCRHAQCDLQSTTDILLGPLAARCRTPFRPADKSRGVAAGAQCCTSDLTLAEFRRLRGRNDRVDPDAESLQSWLAPGGAARGTLVTHEESIALFRELGVDMIPELKDTDPGMSLPPGLNRADLAREMVRAYVDAGIGAERVTLQSFRIDDVLLWQREFPQFATNTLWLDGRFEQGVGFDHRWPETWQPSMGQLRAMGIHTLAPPIPILLDLDPQGRIVPSAYARAARAAGFRLVTWSLERSGPLAEGGGLYYSSIRPAIHDDGDVYRVLDLLVREVGIEAMFSDWPETVSFYANCLLR